MKDNKNKVSKQTLWENEGRRNMFLYSPKTNSSLPLLLLTTVLLLILL